MKESKKGYCRKCKTYFYIHEHHILPKSIFGKKGKKGKLCPNCHTYFHEYSKQHITDPYDEGEALDIWDKWLTSVSVVVSILVIGLVVYFL